MSKHKSHISPEDRRRGGFDIMTHKTKAEVAVVVTLAAVTGGMLVKASHEARQDYDQQNKQDVPAGTVDYYPGDNDARQLVHDLAEHNDPQYTTYIVDTAKQPQNK